MNFSQNVVIPTVCISSLPYTGARKSKRETVNETGSWLQ